LGAGHGCEYLEKKVVVVAAAGGGGGKGKRWGRHA